jgi:SAM-dependent methyltransferase
MERWIVPAWRRRLWQSVPRRGIGLELSAGCVGSESLFPTRCRVVVCSASFDHVWASRARPAPAETYHVVAAPDALPFATSRFDWIVSSLALCRTRRPAPCISELRRLVRPGGLCCLLESVRPTGWRGRLADALSILTGAMWRWFLNHDVAHALNAAGFRIERRLALWSDAVVVLVGRAPARETPPPPSAQRAAPKDLPVRVRRLTILVPAGRRASPSRGDTWLVPTAFVSSPSELT